MKQIRNKIKYSNEDFLYAHPFNYSGSFVKYTDPLYGEAAFEWNFGDSVILSFDIAEDFREFDLVVTLYDFNCIPMYNVTTKADAEGKVLVEIPEDVSTKDFKRGNYFCGIQSVQYVFNDEKMLTTILPLNACMLRVK